MYAIRSYYERSACIVVGVFEPRRLSAVAEQLDRVSDGYLSSLLRRGDLEGKSGQMLLLHQVPGVLSERVLLVGCGKERELDERQFKQIIQKTISTLNETGSMEAVCFLTELHVKGRDARITSYNVCYTKLLRTLTGGSLPQHLYGLPDIQMYWNQLPLPTEVIIVT